MGGSRTPASAPRRIAGRGSRPVPPRDETAPPMPVAGPPGPPDPPAPHAQPGRSAPPASPADPPASEEGGRAAELLNHPRTTAVLCALVAALLLVGLAELAYAKAPDSRVWFWQDDAAGGASACEPVEVGADFEVPERPITVPLLDWRNANQVAADLTVKILNQDWKTFDEHVDEVAELATGTFAKEYPQTAADTRERFLSNKAEYDFAVVGQSVVQACPARMTSLLFLNQFVYKGEGEQRTGPDVFQVRVVVTTVREDGEWLVADLDAQ